MKNNSLLPCFFTLWLILFTLFFTIGCAPLINPQEQAKMLIGTPTITTMITVTTMHQPTITMSGVMATPEPPKLGEPLSSVTPPSSTNTPMPTWTPIPTLNVEQKATLEAREYLTQEFMQTNGNCQLPCWWGIELGQDLNVAGQKFTDLTIPGWNVTSSDLPPSDLPDNNDLMGYIHLGYYDPENFYFNIGVSLKFYTVEGEIQFINVFAERPLRQYGEKEFVRDWEQYFLSSILQKYGQPQYVYLVPLNIADPSPPDHALTLYYPDLGINVSYTFYGDWTEDGLAEICFDITNVRNIELSLYNPKLADVWGMYLLPPELYTDPDLAKLYSAWTWTTQTGMGIDSFYETYKNPKNLDCIQVSQ